MAENESSDVESWLRMNLAGGDMLKAMASLAQMKAEMARRKASMAKSKALLNAMMVQQKDNVMKGEIQKVTGMNLNVS